MNETDGATPKVTFKEDASGKSQISYIKVCTLYIYILSIHDFAYLIAFLFYRFLRKRTYMVLQLIQVLIVLLESYLDTFPATLLTTEL